MKLFYPGKVIISFLFLFALLLSSAACSLERGDSALQQEQTTEPDISHFLVAVEDEPDTVDFQCTTIHYTIAQNVFNRLVEMEGNEAGGMDILPSLAESWEVSEDGRVYTFHLRENVAFSNGAPLTVSDVLYSFIRLLTHPDSCNQDILDVVVGAEELMDGKTSGLEGFQVLGEHDFSITLKQPFEAFLAGLSMPGASIMDEETTREAGPRFGLDPAWTIGTGSFILRKWTPEVGMLLTANPNCWQGPPACEGLDLRFLTEPEEIQNLFDNGELDILDLDEVGDYAEFYIHGDIYQERLFRVPRIGIVYIALNEATPPLNDVKVRKAMQLSLNRAILLNVVYSGLGAVENGIFPHGLYGFNPELPEIPFDPDEAKALLAKAGYPDGFDLTVQVKSSSTQWEMTLMRLAASMWAKTGIRARIIVLDEDEFMSLRKRGEITCYTAMWTADFNDPDNFIYTFFGNRENTVNRSLCYPNEEIMGRVREARSITDPETRLAEYRELERIIIQKDAAWIPLFSRLRVYVLSERVEGVQASWNGSVKNRYRDVVIK
ncbi:MAG: ABC transporter substrate-binding protein [Blautia sp.]|nr:ABC transporter substrate-binding protein [Blautia sp.]